MCSSVFAQQRKISIRDSKGQRPIAGIELALDFTPEGSLILASTDSLGLYFFNVQGAFKLSVYHSDDSISDFSKTYTSLDKDIVVHMQTNDARINPVVITGGGEPRPIMEHAYNVRVIGREKIEKLVAQNLGDVLMNEVNIQLGQDAVLGTSAIMQGIGGQDIKILLNGIPLIGLLNGNVDVSQILMTNVERIEIIEGPMSTMYGTDALGGVINIITKTPVARKFNGRANGYVDNLQNYNFDIGLNTRLSKFLPLTINAGRYFFTGRDFDTMDRHFDWKPKTKWFADATLFYTAKHSTHRFTSTFYKEKLTDRSDAEYNFVTVTGYNSYYRTTRFDNQLHSIFKIDKHNRFEMMNAYNMYSREKNTIKRNLHTGEEKPYRPEDQDTTKFFYWNSRGVYSHNSPTQKYNFIVGYDASRESTQGKRINSVLNTSDSLVNPFITDVALFGSLEYHPKKEFQIRPSIRIIHNNRFGTPFITGVFGPRFKMAPVIPSLQFKYNMSEHLVFRASYSKGFRAPSLKELYFYFVDVNHNVHGNQDLKAETSDNFILAFDYRHKLTETMGTVFGFSLFNNLIKNKINLALVDAQTNWYTYINIGRFRSQGLNMNFEFFDKRYSFSLSTAFLSVTDLLQHADSVTQKNYINGQVSTNFSYKIPKHNLQVSMFSRYTSPTQGYTEQAERYRTGGFFMMDLNFQKKIKMFPMLDLNFGCKNIFGVTKVSTTRKMSGNPHSEEGVNVLIAPGRTLFVKMSVLIK